MIVIEVKGLDYLVSRLRALGAQRIPNYIARALNDVAAEAQKAMIAETQSKLTVRGTWFRTGTRFGYNRQPANKSNLEARVFTRAPWMEEQETKTSRTARSSRIIVPLEPVRAGRTDPKKIPRRLLPSRMGAKLFPIQTKHGVVLFQRMKRAGLRAMWALKRVIRYPRRVHVVDAAKRAVQVNAPSVFERQIANAVREQGLK